MVVKLGKLPYKHDERTLKLARYLRHEKLPPLPEFLDWSKGERNWGMMLNDSLGDCTVAACGHAVQIWTSNAGMAMVTPSDAAILEGYEKWCGYDPSNPDSDQGGVELDVLNQWHKHSLASQKLWAYADCGVGNIENIKRAIQLFGVAYIGVGLPVTAQSQRIWEVVGNPDTDPDATPWSWGGHAVVLIGWNNQKNLFMVVSWGELYWATYDFIHRYCDEAWALLGAAWAASGAAPSGFDYTMLDADLSALGGNVFVVDKNKKKKRKKNRK